LVIGFCDLEFICNLVLVIWNFTLEQLVFDQSFYLDQTGRFLAGGGADT